MTATFRWWTEAACMTIEHGGRQLTSAERTALFFPKDDNNEDTTAYEYPISICNKCPVKSPCLEDALLEDRRTLVPEGIRGGMTGQERYVERIRREGQYVK